MQHNISYKAQQLNQNGYFFNRAYYFQKALLLIRSNWLSFIGFTAVGIFTLGFLIVRVPQYAQLINLIIAGPVYAGYFIVVHQLNKGKEVRFENFFDGFKIFAPTMLTHMVSSLFIMISSSALFYLNIFLVFIPAFFFYTIYLFAIPLVTFEKLSFWSALESSRIIIQKNFFQALVFISTLVFINIIGLLTLVGLLFTVPLSFAMIYAAYEDIYGFEQNEETDFNNDFSHFR